MEWKGINLSDFNQQQWLNRNLRHLIILLSTSIITLIIAIILFYLKLDLENQFIMQNQQQIQLENKIVSIKNRITRLKSHQVQEKSNYLTKTNIEQFLTYLSNLKVNGVIEYSQLYFDDFAKLKLVSKSSSQKQFDYIINQLKHNNYLYKIDYVQQNDKNLFDFSLVIEIGKQDEKLDFE